MSHFEFEYSAIFLFLVPIVCIWLCPPKKVQRYFPHIHLFGSVATLIHKEKFLYALIYLLFITALASPISFSAKLPNDKKGRDLVFVLDSSGSMNESGFSKDQESATKFEVVTQLFKSFIGHRSDDNVGVVLFGTFAFSIAPITYDMHSLLYILNFLEVGLAGENTAIGDGLYQALRMLQNSQAKNRVILLFTDGYQNSGSHSIKEMVQKAKQMHVKIYTIGIGQKQDFDAGLLEKIAKESGGLFFQAKNKEELEAVYAKLDALEPSKIRSQNYLNKEPLFFYPLIAASLLLLYLIQKRRVS